MPEGQIPSGSGHYIAASGIVAEVLHEKFKGNTDIDLDLLAAEIVDALCPGDTASWAWLDSLNGVEHQGWYVLDTTNRHHRFVLVRDTDVTGVSGTGIVAEGVWWPHGDVVALRWTSEWPTSVVFHDRGIASVEAIHGHNGATRIVWLDPLPYDLLKQQGSDERLAP